MLMWQLHWHLNLLGTHTAPLANIDVLAASSGVLFEVSQPFGKAWNFCCELVWHHDFGAMTLVPVI